MKGRLAKYSLWQFRDFFFNHGIGIAIIGLLWGWVLIAPLRQAIGNQLGAVPATPVWALAPTTISTGSAE